MEALREPTLVQTVCAHRSEVSCADAFGARLVTGAGDRSLRLWRWAAGAGWGEEAREPAAHRYGTTAARWAATGVLLASGGVDGVVRVWCGRTLGARRTLAAPAAPAVRALCWAGRRLLAGHDDGALCVWLVGPGVLAARLHAHEGALHAVATPACAALLLTACTHGVLKVFDFVEVCRSGTDGASPAPLTWVDGAHDMGALCADASEDGRAAATGGHDALVRVWRARAGAGGLAAGGALTLEGHAAAVTALRWAGGALLASASLDRTARLWAPLAAACLHVVHAHSRYLTCVVLAHDLRYMVTGSNDKSVRMWSLGTLTLDDELEPPCAVLAHFGLGDLEGIGPVDWDELPEEEKEPAAQAAREDEATAACGARRAWRAPAAHAGAVNCIATCGDRLATASSDGTVKVFRWCAEARALVVEHTLAAHQYPAMAVDFGAGGALLLTAGLDGRAALWDAQSGVQLRSLCVPSAGSAGGGEAGGGGGVRAARVSPHRPPLLLLATDDGLAPLWSLAAAEPTPLHVFGGHAEAATCCAWSRAGRVAATGAASGGLRVHAPRPAPRTLHHQPHAHDLGVQSCDFAPSSTALGLPDCSHVLASAGCDSLIKLWIVECAEDDDDSVSIVTVRLVHELEAHGGGVTCVRWGPSAESEAGAGAGVLLASAGADQWARVWRALRGDSGGGGGGGGVELRPVASVPAPGAGGALAVALLGADARLLAAGSMAGELALWQLPGAEPCSPDTAPDHEGALPCLWDAPDVARWLREYVTQAPGAQVSPEEEARLLRRALLAGITGARLLREPLDELLHQLGYGEDVSEAAGAGGAGGATRARLADEVRWLRRGPPPPQAEAGAAHALLCPLTHRLLREPARAADGFSYERAAILDWFIAAEGAVSPVSGRRLRSARAPPNYALRDQLRAFLDQHAS